MPYWSVTWMDPHILIGNKLLKFSISSMLLAEAYKLKYSICNSLSSNTKKTCKVKTLSVLRKKK